MPEQCEGKHGFLLGHDMGHRDDIKLQTLPFKPVFGFKCDNIEIGGQRAVAVVAGFQATAKRMFPQRFDQLPCGDQTDTVPVKDKIVGKRHPFQTTNVI